MLLKKVICMVFALCLVCTTTGCWDSMDINQKTLVVTVITDKEENGFAFYIESPNLSMGKNTPEGSGQTEYNIVYAKGTSFADARRHLNAKVDTPIFLGTVKSLVLTDELGKYGIEEYMLRLQSDIQYRKALNVVTSFTDPEDLLAVQPVNNVSIGESIDDTITSLEQLGKLDAYSMSDILEFIYSDTCFVLVNVDVLDGVIAYNGFTVFHDNKMIDFIPMEESRGLVWILGDKLKRIYVGPIDGCEATIEVTLKDKKIEPQYLDGKLTFDIKYTFDSYVMYLSKNIKFDKDKQKLAKEALLKNIISDIAQAINHSQSIGCDYLGFKEYFRLKYPNELKTLTWSDLYLNASFNISAETSLFMGSVMDFEASGHKPNY